jgi:tetratricopeptide (TPR) repeat protein
MRFRGVSAERLYRRAIEYRSLGKQGLYESDLDAAFECDAAFFPVRIELAKLKLQQNDLQRARQLIEPLRDAKDRNLRAVALATSAEIDAIEKKWREATERFTLALEIRPEVEWYLQRAEVQHRAQDSVDLLAGLREGYAKTGSPVLLRELCDRLIDAAETQDEGEREAYHREASAIIERELHDCRFYSHWYIRRARLQSFQGDFAAARTDLEDATKELQSRISTHLPDPELLRELATARQILQRLPARGEQISPSSR